MFLRERDDYKIYFFLYLIAENFKFDYLLYIMYIFDFMLKKIWDFLLSLIFNELII